MGNLIENLKGGDKIEEKYLIMFSFVDCPFLFRFLFSLSSSGPMRTFGGQKSLFQLKWGFLCTNGDHLKNEWVFLSVNVTICSQ